MKTRSKEEEMFDNVEVNEEVILQDNSPKKPRRGSKEWTSYVLSHLSDDEYRKSPNGAPLPTTAGLCRLVTLLIGPIHEDISQLVHRETDLSTVEHTLKVFDREIGQLITVTGIGDCTPKNCDPPFNRFLDANADTRALGRSCKRALSINVCTAEEVSRIAEIPDVDENKLSTPQAKAIMNLVDRLNINLNKFLNMGKNKFDSLMDVDQDVATNMMKLLNSYMQNVGSIPKEIKL